MDRFDERYLARDWSGLEALCAPTCIWDDRRRGFLTSGDRDMFVASARFIASVDTRVSRTSLATYSAFGPIAHSAFTNASW